MDLLSITGGKEYIERMLGFGIRTFGMATIKAPKNIADMALSSTQCWCKVEYKTEFAVQLSQEIEGYAFRLVERDSEYQLECFKL
jgi:hypothetical protein